MITKTLVKKFQCTLQMFLTEVVMQLHLFAIVMCVISYGKYRQCSKT